MSKDREKKVTRAREAKLEADHVASTKLVTALEAQCEMLRCVAVDASDSALEMWSQAWLLMWGCLDATFEARAVTELAHVFLDRLKMAADGSTCAFCVAVDADKTKQAAFRDHVRSCERHPAYELRHALEHARHEFVAATRIEDVQSKALLAVIDAALGPAPGPVMQPLVAEPAAAQEAV